MSSQEIVILAGMCIVTFGIRYVITGFSSRFVIGPGFRYALEFVPPAVLTAIVVPAMLMPGGASFDLSLSNPYIPAVLTAVIAQACVKKLLLTIVLGMAVFFAWKYLWAPH